MRRSAALLLGSLLPFAGCVDEEGSGETSRAACLAAADPSRAASARPSVVALLETVHPGTGATMGFRTRLVRVSLPDGALEATRRVPWQPGPRTAVDPGPARLDSWSGPLLARTRDGAGVVALLRDPVSPRNRIAVLDARSLRARCSVPLARGVRYTGMALGRSRVYAYGARRTSRGRWDAVVTVADLRAGAPAGTQTVRESNGNGKDWYVYRGALSEDERRLVLSYHGGDTTGADWFRVSPAGRVSPGGAARGTVIGWAHGGVEAAGSGFVAATGRDRLIVLDRSGRTRRRMPVGATNSHLMDFVVDPSGRLAYVSGCGRRPAIQRVGLVRGGVRRLPSGNVCGRPLAVHDDRYVVLDANRVGRLGFPGRPDGIRILDLSEAGAGTRVPLPPSAHALDVEVVGAPTQR